MPPSASLTCRQHPAPEKPPHSRKHRLPEILSPRIGGEKCGAAGGARERAERRPEQTVPSRTSAALCRPAKLVPSYTCLLYTSDAADDLHCVDLGGRRIIKTKK